MERVNRVLGLLYDRDGYWGHGELAAAGGVNARELAMALELIAGRGHRLDFSPASGVRLARAVRPDAYLIERDLGVRRIGRNVICFDEVDSTNDVAADAARQPDTDGLVVTAESQRRGRGRLGRTWRSPAGANVLMSVVVSGADRSEHEVVTIAAGLATAEGIERACGLACALKWPNDVLVGEAKVAGVLIDMRTPAPGRSVLVVGVGVNVAASPPDGAIDRPAVHLEAVSAGPVERIEVIREVLRRLDAWVCAAADGRTDRLHEAWMSRCGMLNRRVEVVCAGRRHVGRVLDVSPLEGLILAEDSGRRVHLPARSSSVVG